MSQRPQEGVRAVAEDAPVFVISVAAELAGMHAQTLRQYDRLGLVQPRPHPGGGRRYSPRDIALLREVQRLSRRTASTWPGSSGSSTWSRRWRHCRRGSTSCWRSSDMCEARRMAAEAAVPAGYRRDLVPQQPAELGHGRLAAAGRP